MKIKAELVPGKVAVITGGSSGIGKAIACQLADRGMDLWIMAQRMEILESAKGEIESHRQSQNQLIEAVSADVADPAQVHEAVVHVIEKSGPPHLLVNSAGVTYPGYIQELPIGIFRWMMEVDYFGTVYMTKEVLPAMIERRSGYILNISSFVGYIGGFGYSAYGAAKFAVRGFTDALRQEMKPYGIGVSIVFPSDTDTPQLEFENRFKPSELKALANFTGAMKPDAVAKIILKAISKGQYTIFPAFEGSFWRTVDKISSPLVQFIIDTIVAGEVKKKNSLSPEKE